MRVADLFDISYGQSLELNALTLDPNGINLISRTTKRNGVDARVSPVAGIFPSPAGTLSVALGANPLTTFVQIEPYYCGRDVAVLTPRRPMTVNEKLWWAMCLRAHRHRYNYGRQANRTLADLQLPDQVPDWVSQMPLPNYIDLRFSALPPLPPTEVGVTLLDTTGWKTFLYPEIFNIVQGERITKAQLKSGPTPFVRASQFRNGIVGTYDLPFAHEAGTITVPYNGSVAQAFYQPAPFFASDDVFVLRPRVTVGERVALFLCAVIRLERTRFGYGYKWNMERMKKTTIRLPVTADNQPDWDFMDRYMASLPFSAITTRARLFTEDQISPGEFPKEAKAETNKLGLSVANRRERAPSQST